ncbi:LacI family DNA-binding transcriptional regulator [Actinoplanes couchii]|uniref:LacI-family transcriptional regulator n=1 Tax=Actinoplanes couchii TaxID=403638 RepID=A0ABQ3XSF6_9ACTN|nr:LacI family DNA-binding transcriptional regulator [Actinoplanes couchii]MDR6320082.1 DNA-binding LacI/PurR family transcriptional regulator [Actinoplanes couchii]GID61446.1 putative LacI-family transcriptional regulator [Actinoplanes couchii]
MGNPTLHDVARRAGVGKSTVSNVLAGTGRPSEATREKVLAAVAELGYAPNRAARLLRGGRTGVVGVYVPGNPSLSEYYMRFVFGVMEPLSARGRDTVILSGADRSTLPPMDGVILSDPDETDPAIAALLASGLPTVCFERPFGTSVSSPDIVLWCDHRAALTTVLDDMRAAGGRWPALMIPPETGDWTAQLGVAYRDWCARHGVTPVIGSVDWIPTPAQLDTVADTLLTEHPGIDGLVCGPVDTAPAVLPTLRRHGRTVGVDFQLATGTESTAARLGQPPITAIDIDPLEAGRRCAALLDGLLTGEPGGEIEHPVTVHRRGSTVLGAPAPPPPSRRRR